MRPAELAAQLAALHHKLHGRAGQKETAAAEMEAEKDGTEAAAARAAAGELAAPS